MTDPRAAQIAELTAQLNKQRNDKEDYQAALISARTAFSTLTVQRDELLVAIGPFVVYCIAAQDNARFQPSPDAIVLETDGHNNEVLRVCHFRYALATSTRIKSQITAQAGEKEIG